MIGVFGGTFDPVHYGHLRSALEAKEGCDLTEVRLIPSSVPPHRSLPNASPQQRLAMLKLAVNNRPDMVIDTRELERSGNSFMVDTLASLKADFARQTFVLFIGCDAFNGLTAWHQWQHLFDYAHVVVMTRPGFESVSLDGYLEARLVSHVSQLKLSNEGKLCFFPVTQLDISATAIRKLVAEKCDPSFLLPDAVIEYIKRHHLYEQNARQNGN